MNLAPPAATGFLQRIHERMYTQLELTEEFSRDALYKRMRVLKKTLEAGFLANLMLIHGLHQMMKTSIWKPSQKCRSELSQLHHRVLQLGEEASTHQAQSEKNQLTIQVLTHGLEEAMLREELQPLVQEAHETQLKATEERVEEVETRVKNREALL
ncbi:ninein-like protein isoform X2 [Moschus berezovskii]|uniref:ninein-like protein isoform X2 n=1 Tax=Moschus berezovskii TaxID=68408 RepID=UPI002443E524|nr:ninein-like protein isoform X2 [Moschus berezovskii]XP_055277756.1 ninein-like protein isoform X2 [Moschus berezovskii]